MESSVLWDREEGLFVWQGLMEPKEWEQRVEELRLPDDHPCIPQSGGVWTKAIKHQGRRHMLRFDPDYPFPGWCYCLLCGLRGLHPWRYKTEEEIADIQRRAADLRAAVR